MLNDFQDKLYQDLMTLVEESDAFYYKDFTYEATTYRIFNYRLASFTEFTRPGALECRGVMFKINNKEEAVELSSLPMEKFFNLGENPMTMNLDLSKIEEIAEKADGSLMSTYIHWTPNGLAELRLKSKGSIASEQCLHAMDFLHLAKNWEFHWDLRVLTIHGYTVNLEWCAPQHRIVLGYGRSRS